MSHIQDVFDSVGDYDSEKETVEEWVARRLDAGMKAEADIWADSILYGTNAGGELVGLLKRPGVLYFEPSADAEDLNSVENAEYWERANTEFGVSFPNTKQGFSMAFDPIEHRLDLLFQQAHPNYYEMKRVRTQYRRRQLARKRRKRWTAIF